MPAEPRQHDAEAADPGRGDSAFAGPVDPGTTYRVAASVESVTGYSGRQTIAPGVVQARVRTVFGALRPRPFRTPLVHPGPDNTVVHLRWMLLAGQRAALLLHKPVTRACVPLSRRTALPLVAELRAAGLTVSEVSVRTALTATRPLESRWLRHAVAGRQHPSYAGRRRHR